MSNTVNSIESLQSSIDRYSEYKHCLVFIQYSGILGGWFILKLLEHKVVWYNPLLSGVSCPAFINFFFFLISFETFFSITSSIDYHNINSIYYLLL